MSLALSTRVLFILLMEHRICLSILFAAAPVASAFHVVPLTR